MAEEAAVCGLYLWQDDASDSGLEYIPSVSALAIDSDGGITTEVVEVSVGDVHEIRESTPYGRLVEFVFPDCHSALSMGVTMSIAPEANSKNGQSYVLGAKLDGEQGFVLPIPSTDPSRQRVLVNAGPEQALLRMENFHVIWETLVNGDEDKIYRTGDNFQVVEVPLGISLIQFSYWSVYDWLHRTFRIGLAVAYILMLVALFSDPHGNSPRSRVDDHA